MTPMRAMVIDDSRAMRMILKRIVTKLSFEAVEAGDGKEALDLLADMTEVPELALIDWNMPNMNGLEFVTKVRAETRLREMTLSWSRPRANRARSSGRWPRAPTNT